MAIPKRVRQPAARARKAQDSASTKSRKSAPSPTSTSSPQEGGGVKAEPIREQHGSFHSDSDACDSESEESSSQSLASTTDDEEPRNHGSAFGDHVEIKSRARHIRILSVADSDIITVEELNTEEIFDFNNVLRPSRVQDASSDDSDLSDSDSRSSLAADFENLQCGPDPTEADFERCCKRRSMQSRRRWRKGGNHKRHHDQTVGSGEEFEDVTPLDPPSSNPSRRLRRRTGEPQDKPGRSQILGNVILEANLTGTYDEYFLSQWTFDSMVIDDNDSSDSEDQ